MGKNSSNPSVACNNMKMWKNHDNTVELHQLTYNIKQKLLSYILIIVLSSKCAYVQTKLTNDIILFLCFSNYILQKNFVTKLIDSVRFA